MLEQLKTLFMLLYQPGRAFSRVLDQGSTIFAIVAAIAAQLLLSLATGIAAATGQPEAELAGGRLLAVFGDASLSTLLFIAALFVPAVIWIYSQWEGLGSLSVALQRDFVPMLACTAMAWAVSHLVAAGLALIVIPAAGSHGPSNADFAGVLDASLLQALGLYLAPLAAAPYFLILSAFAVRTISGTSAARSVAVVAGGAVATFLGSFVLGGLGGYLMSPMMLLWLYWIWRPDFSAFTGGLKSRQSFRRHLEASTLNPRDADAHYQLGLIYLQRHNLTEATARFQKAAEIDPSEPDPHFQLGRVALEQGRFDEAKVKFERVARLDDKHSSNEIWRDLGHANVELGNLEAAVPQLELYFERREYDPEGLFWLGEAYRKAGRAEAARVKFQQTIEAAETAPRHLRGRAGKWLSRARGGLKSLPRAA